ncbi:Phage Tail Collar Domain protein [Photorhabdus australis subsp. thailandensis]|uniref:Phage Tail Collar Domain protein n=1 Tax=Photorhabdus australis subsp. thailandensis TaxID=2805096 RepID=A0A1C0TZ38_9GAMM|nr:tail fiber protein [Photorhabdus australis]OCQ50943.1 Phage Tail Collar Domain protein [Photorhabdus australis subsp. thailandensis]
MFGLDNPSGVSVMPPITPASNPTPLWFTEGGAGLAVSYPGQEWFNIVQAELLSVLQAASIKPDKSKLDQLAVAIKSIVAEKSIGLTDKLGNSSVLAASQKLVSEVNGNANSKLAKNQNGADIPDKNAFVKNLGLAETVERANNAVPSSRKINGKALSGDVSLSAGDVGAFPGVTPFESFPQRSYVGAFSSGPGTGWAKGLNFGYINGDVGQIYVNSIGDMYAYYLNSNTKSYGGIVNTHPVGAPIPWPQLNPPSGYLTCNGQAFDKSLYPNLAVAYPNGRVPDLRGEFIRGWDDGRGVDMGRVCGSWQAQQVQYHSHVSGHGGRAGGQFGLTNTWNGAGSYSDDARQKLPFTNNGSDYDGFTNNGAVGNETRPRNVAFNYIVRAA